MSETFDFSIIISNHNDDESLKSCLQSINAISEAFSYEVILVDHSSQDRCTMWRSFCANLSYLSSDGSGNESGAYNRALPLAKGNILLFLTPSTQIRSPILEKIMAFFENCPNAGACGFPIDKDTTLLGCVLGESLLYFFRQSLRLAAKARDCAFVTSLKRSCLAIPKDLFNDMGGFDNSFAFFGKEADLCWRLQKRGRAIASLPRECVVLSLSFWCSRYPMQMSVEYHSSLYRGFRKKGWPSWKIVLLKRILSLKCAFLALFSGVFLQKSRVLWSVFLWHTFARLSDKGWASLKHRSLFLRESRGAWSFYGNRACSEKVIQMFQNDIVDKSLFSAISVQKNSSESSLKPVFLKNTLQKKGNRYLVMTDRFTDFGKKTLSLFKSSVTQKHWELSRRFQNLGIGTPLPVLYAQERFLGYVSERIFLSQLEEHWRVAEEFLKNFQNKSWTQRRVIVEAFAEFLAHTHNNGLFYTNWSTSLFVDTHSLKKPRFCLLPSSEARFYAKLSLSRIRTVFESMAVMTKKYFFRLHRDRLVFLKMYCENRNCLQDPMILYRKLL